MPAHVREQGRYELFEARGRRRVLVLNEAQWFTWADGPQGPLLARIEPESGQEPAAREGRFYLVAFENDPKYGSMPHLFLGEQEHFRVIRLPEGLPTVGVPRPVVETGETLSVERLENYLQGASSLDRGAAPAPPPDRDAVAIVAHYLVGIAFPASRAEVLRHARANAAPEAVLEQLQKLREATFSSIVDVTQSLD